MALSKLEQKNLRGQAHHLKPVVQLGQKGLTDAVLDEINTALNAHELIKISIAGSDKASRREVTEQICQASGADLVQMIGLISVIYRPTSEEE